MSETHVGGDGGGGGDDGGTPMTWRALWAQTADAVADRASARWLCEVASGSLDGDEFLARLDESATVRMVAHQDVLGEWGFRHLMLAVDRRVLIPRPETELVAEIAIGLAAACSPTRTVVDLGTGTGAIGLSMAYELPLNDTVVWITDASADAIDVARANLAGIGPAAVNVRVALGSWFDALADDTVFDVIVSNPPYVAVGSPDLERGVEEWEPPDALFAGDDGLDDIRVIAAGAPARLRDGGSLVLEIGAEQGGAVADILRRSGLVDVEVRADLSGRDRVAIARRPA
jgi:release factor glutamine methyltransferase